MSPSARVASLNVEVGPVSLKSPLVAAAGTVGSVVEFAQVVDFSLYGAAVAKSVAPVPWKGQNAPRIAPTDVGMLNGIGIQNPGIDVWATQVSPHIDAIRTPVWGSIVAHNINGFAEVAAKMANTGVKAIEINLSCPNLDGRPFALDVDLTTQVVASVRATTDLPLGAKLSPDAMPITPVAEAAMSAGADWLVVANTVMGAAIDPDTRRPLLSGLIGGYSGTAVRPITMRCVLNIARDLPSAPIVACGGVSDARHVVEYILAGADAVAIGTAHFADPKVAQRITKDLEKYMRKHSILALSEIKGAFEPW
jgi:dihydroorotate dehydrogenase (NAD+) catalytic subunit